MNLEPDNHLDLSSVKGKASNRLEGFNDGAANSGIPSGGSAP